MTVYYTSKLNNKQLGVSKMANFLECTVCGNDNQDREWFVTMVDMRLEEHSPGESQPVCGFCEESELHLEETA
jgi:hypothetical protein